MGAEKSEIWRLIDLISVSIPFGKERLEEIFGFSLKEVSRHGDFVFYKGIRDVNHFASIPSGKSFVNELDFRSNAKNPSKSLLIINVDEKVSCVSRDDASAQYPNLEFYESPSPPPLRGGESANRKSTFHTVFSSAQSWGEISFTFSSKDARVIGCLGNVIFSFKKS